LGDMRSQLDRGSAGSARAEKRGRFSLGSTRRIKGKKRRGIRTLSNSSEIIPTVKLEIRSQLWIMC